MGRQVWNNKNRLARAGGTVAAQQSTQLGGATGRARVRPILVALGLSYAIAVLSGAAHATSARLDFGVSTLSFPSADPDAVSTIDAVENPIAVDVTISGPDSTMSQLTVQAAGDLISGPDQIAIDHVGWQGQGEGFVPGPATLSKDEPRLVGQWVGRGTKNGILRFGMENSWDYAAGAYSQTVVYTLVAY